MYLDNIRVNGQSQGQGQGHMGVFVRLMLLEPLGLDSQTEVR